MPQHGDAGIAVEQLRFTLVVSLAESFLVPLRHHAINFPGAIVRRKADLNAGDLLQFPGEVFGLARILPVEGSEVQPRVFLRGQTDTDHFLAPDVVRPAGRIWMRARIQPRRGDEILAPRQYSGEL